MSRADLKTYSLPVAYQDALREIAEIEHRSMSAVLRVMIDERSEKYGIDIRDEAEEPVNVTA